MTNSKLNAVGFRRALLAMADKIIESEARLNALDSAIGDGDHGITMRLGFEAVKQRLAQLEDGATFDLLLVEAAQAFMGVTGGAIGIILAKMLMGAGSALRATSEFGTPELNSMLAGMETAVSKAGKAKPGDKTILDGIHAAHAAVEAAVQSQQPLPEALAVAAGAAEAAAEGTANMVCRIGRASRLGERTLGHPDPGAVSFSIMMRAFEQNAQAA
jgi:dihydroxyacetone kinase phosphoprotein-dependent L subunit